MLSRHANPWQPDLATDLSSDSTGYQWFNVQGVTEENRQARVDAAIMHGKDDAVIPYSQTINAAHLLRDLGGDVTAEVLPFVGHEIHPEFIELAISKLSSHILHRLWLQAQKEEEEAEQSKEAT